MRVNHPQGTCVVCAYGGDECRCTAFVPAEPECDCNAVNSAPLGHRLDCASRRKKREPEAPEEDEYPACQFCGNWHASEDYCIQLPEAPVPRPPFLVAYATGSGALNELALPGEASVAVVDGSLVISHASSVLGIASVKPLELEN